MFNESLFYDPKEVNKRSQLQEEIEEIIEVFEVPRFQQQEKDKDLDLESDSDTDSASVREEEKQEKQEGQVRRETFYEEKDNTLPEAFLDDFESMTRGFEPMLPTLKLIPELSTSYHSMPK